MKLEIENAKELAAAKEAVEKLRAESIRHVGRFVRRMDLPCEQSTRERALSEGWREANNSRTWSILHSLLLESSADQTEPRILVTPEIARAVATVIQWLGTNVGFCDLCEWLKAAGYKVIKEK